MAKRFGATISARDGDAPIAAVGAPVTCWMIAQYAVWDSLVSSGHVLVIVIVAFAAPTRSRLRATGSR